MSPRTITVEPWGALTVRRARKAGRCAYWLGAAGRCPERIEPGDEYIEGDMDPGIAGGFGRERWCMKHAEALGA